LNFWCGQLAIFIVLTRDGSSLENAGALAHVIVLSVVGTNFDGPTTS